MDVRALSEGTLGFGSVLAITFDMCTRQPWAVGNGLHGSVPALDVSPHAGVKK